MGNKELAPLDGGSLKTFWMLWASQTISLLGTDITRFCLRLWAYRNTKTISEFTWITLFAEVRWTNQRLFSLRWCRSVRRHHCF